MSALFEQPAGESMTPVNTATWYADGFQADVTRIDDTTARVRFVGELDACSAGVAAESLAAAGAGGHVAIEVDTAELEFCDAAGLRCLFEANRRCTERGGGLRVVNPRPPLTRLLAIVGADTLLNGHRHAENGRAPRLTPARGR